MEKTKVKLEMKKLHNLPIIGAIISGIVASFCCIGPAVLAVLSIGGAGLFSKFEIYRPYFIGLTIALLGLAFYLTYRKREVVCEDGTCKIKNAGKWNKIALWIATVLVVLFIAFTYLNLLSQNPSHGQTVTESVEITIPVEGMTCTGCELNVENAVKKFDGIIQADADYKKGEVYVKFEKGNIINSINKAGYKANKPKE